MELLNNSITPTRRSSRTVKRKTASDFIQWNTKKSIRKTSPKSFKDQRNVRNNKSQVCNRTNIGLLKNDGTVEILDKPVKHVQNFQGNKHKRLKDEKLKETKCVGELSEDYTKPTKHTEEFKTGSITRECEKVKAEEAEDCTKAEQLIEKFVTGGSKKECEKSKAEDAEDFTKTEQFIEKVEAGGSKKKCKAEDAVRLEFQCTVCSKSLGSRDSLQKHMFRHTGKKPYVCEVCSMSFSMKSYLSRHMQRHSSEKPFFCEKCGKGFSRKTSVIAHLNSHTDEKNFACAKCDKTFKLKQSLQAHMNTHSLEKMCVCHLCGKSFGCDRYLVQHMITHKDNGSYKCKICEKLFSSKQTWEEHARRHAKEKTVTCEVCSKRFYNKKELALHKRFHINVTDFKCQICSMYFKMKKSLDFHLSKIHGRNYPCRICGKALTNKRALNSHVFREHRKLRLPRKGKLDKYETASFKKAICPVCGLLLSNKYRLQKHLIKIHGSAKRPLNMTHMFKEKAVETVPGNVLHVDAENIEESFSSNGKQIYTSPECEYFENGNKSNLQTFTVENVNGNTDEIVVIWKEKMTQGSDVQTFEEGNQNVANTNMRNDRSKEDYSTYQEMFDTFIPKPDSTGDTPHTEEVYVIVKSEDGSYDMSLNGRYDSGANDGYSRVAHEVIIQPESTVEVATEETIVGQEDLTKLKILGHVTEHERNFAHGTVHISTEEDVKNAIRLSAEVAQNTVQISPEGAEHVIEISTEVDQNTVQISTDVTKNNAEISTQDFEDKVQLSTKGAEDTVHISTESVNSTAHIARDSIDTVLNGHMPITGTAEELSKFEKEMLSSITKLRKFDGYGQFLNNMMEFVLRERQQLNLNADTQS